METFCTINHHKHLVMKGCFCGGLYKQGLLHDLSKYTPTEFLVGCKHYQGTMSRNNAERRIRDTRPRGCTTKGGTNIKMEYWIDYGVPDEGGDRDSAVRKCLCGTWWRCISTVAASKNYQKERYTDRSALEYYLHGKDFHRHAQGYARASLNCFCTLGSLSGASRKSIHLSAKNCWQGRSL